MKDKRSCCSIERTVDGIVGELNECASWPQLAELLVARLDGVVAGENPAYNEVALPSLEVTATLMHDHYMAEAIRTLPAYNHHAQEHPLLKICSFEDSLKRVVSFSESLTLREVEANPVYNEALKHTDARDQILFSVVLGGNRFVTICQNRMQWGYSDTERYNMDYFASQLIPVLQRKHGEFAEREKLDLLLGHLSGKLGCPVDDLRRVTPAELRVAAGLVKGLSYASIAEQLGITRRTVAAHCGRLYEKMHLENRHQLAAAFHEAFGSSGSETT